MLIAIKSTWELHGLKVVYGRVHLRVSVQHSCDGDLWFITFSVADSIQNAILCQQEAKELQRCGSHNRRAGNGRQALQRGETRKQVRMETSLKAAYHKGHGMRVKQCDMFPLTPLCSSKLSRTKTNRCSSFISLLIYIFFLVSHSCVCLTP